LSLGCQDDGRLPTYPVRGKVVLADGRPLPGGWIVCESELKAPAARGTINENGEFVLGTYEQHDGGVAGKHRVSITPAAPRGHDPDRGRPPELIDRRYALLETSGLELEVVAEDDNYVKLTVLPPGQ
jgi:hypothetical protein